MASNQEKDMMLSSAKRELSKLRSSAHRNATLYFHYPCFDGLVSAAIAWEFLEQWAHWRIAEICPVNYDQKQTWANRELAPTSAVVDFLFHPKATLWADHHSTAFSSAHVQQSNEPANDQWRAYDPGSRSCAALLWHNVAGSLQHLDRFGEMIFWADKIDSAAYDSVEEALFGNAPALRINLSLILADGPNYAKLIVEALRSGSLSDAARMPEVTSRAAEATERIKKGLEEVRRHIHLVGDIAVLEATQNEDVVISRYAPYHFCHRARYSIVMIESETGVKITAMRNPWMEFRSIELGALFQKYGGGGHQRIGSLVIPPARSEERSRIFADIIKDVQAQVAAQLPEGRPSLAGSPI